MRKIFFALILLSLVVPLAAATSDFAYIVKTSQGADSFLTQQLTTNNYTYDIILESQISSTNLSVYRGVIIGDQELVAPENINSYKYRTIVIDSFDYYKLSTTSFQLGWSATKGTKGSPTPLKIVDTASPIVKNLPLTFNAYTTSTLSAQTSFLSGQKPIGIGAVVSAQSSNSDMVIATLNPGQQLLNGKTLEQRNIFFGIPKAQYWSAETKILFKNSLSWLLFGEDRDADGFLSDIDCNDNDAEVHPGAQEIPYDDIDQDCTGSDLNDIDEDGFKSSVVPLGTDCDDFDSFIHPGALNLTKNCVNDAPTLQIILPITVHEGIPAAIDVFATDPENDPLIYTINDLRFTLADSTFVWNTTFEDAGEYNFNVTVSDSQLSSSRIVTVRILSTNRPPVSTSPAEITWNEDSSLSVNLSNYFVDLDADKLYFGVYNTSNEVNIGLTSEDNVIFNFSSILNYNGNDWIQFYATDNKSVTPSDIITLNVLPVNDAPTFTGNIANFSWNEDQNLTNAVNLSQYFSDIDSNLTFSHSDIENVNVIINQGLVSFSPAKDFAGNLTLNFSAADGEFTTSSNEILLTINNAGEPPELLPLNCTVTLNEEEETSCLLEAADFENDSITFNSTNENNLHCVVEDNGLTYSSYKDYNGIASCDIVSTDKDGSSYSTLSVNITPVNDAPAINSFNPLDNVRLLEGKTQQFSISASDMDSNSLIVQWFINNELASPSNHSASFLFSKPKGAYNVSALVSDGLSSTNKSWNAVVGAISEFTCSEVGGSICSANQLCSGSFLGVKDTNLCCSTSCIPIFKDANHCEVINSSLGLRIIEPTSSDSFDLGKQVRVEVELDNNMDKEQDIDVTAQLYNLDADEVVGNEESTSTILSSGRTRTVAVTLDIPTDEDLDLESDNFAVFVKAEDKICNQKFISIDINRLNDAIEVTKFDAPPEAACGDIIKARTTVQNMGSNNEDVVLTLSNKDLKISEKSDKINIEQYGDKDKYSKQFDITIPENIQSGEYSLLLQADYATSKRSSAASKIKISCENETQSVNTENDSEGTITLQSTSSPSEVPAKADNSGLLLMFSLIFLVSVAAATGLVIFILFKK